jgi:elongation factor P
VRPISSKICSIVEDLQIQTPSARGGASLFKFRFRNLLTKQKTDKTFKGDDSLQDVDFSKREVQFSYAHQDSYVFTDLQDYSEITLSAEHLGEQTLYLTEDLEGILVLLSEGRALAIQLPPVVDIQVAECDPSIRGASATARTKPAKLTTGLVVQVPEYLAPGEVIRVDTRTGKFVSRA